MLDSHEILFQTKIDAHNKRIARITREYAHREALRHRHGTAVTSRLLRRVRFCAGRALISAGQQLSEQARPADYPVQRSPSRTA